MHRSPVLRPGDVFLMNWSHAGVQYYLTLKELPMSPEELTSNQAYGLHGKYLVHCMTEDGAIEELSIYGSDVEDDTMQVVWRRTGT